LILGRDPATSIVVACVGVRRISAEACEIDPYYPNPLPGAHFMALDLDSAKNAEQGT